MKTLQRTRGADCLSDLQMDRWAAKELDAETERAFGEHLLACSRCKDRREEMTRMESQFFEGGDTKLSRPYNVISLPEGKNKTRNLAAKRNVSRIVFRAAPMLALAAGVLLYLRGAGVGPSDDTTRTKGSAHVEVFRKRGETVTGVTTDDRVMPGDQLRFTYSSPRPHYVAIFSVDGSGHASTYFPSGPAAAYVEPGRDVPLAGAVELDAVLGQETLLAVFCEEPFEVGSMQQSLKASSVNSFSPKGCTVDRTRLQKVVPP